MRDLSRWRGLVTLVGEVVEHGSRSVEEIHKVTASRGFAIAGLLPVAEEPLRVIRAVHDTSVSLTYAGVRGVTQVVKTTLTVALDVAESTRAKK